MLQGPVSLGVKFGEKIMTRQQSLNVIWKHLLIIFVGLLVVAIIVSYAGDDFRVPALIFILGNFGSYVGIHRNLGGLQDNEVAELSGSWLGLIVPSFVGGILALVLYLLFLSGIIAGDLFPKFTPDEGAGNGFESIFHQHGNEMTDYAKLLFWAFVAGFNQKYVVDVIDSIKSKVTPNKLTPP